MNARDASGWERKVDHRLRALWSRTAPGDRGGLRVSVFVRVTDAGSFAPPDGLALGSVAGNIATATLTLSALSRIAEAPAVEFLELAQPLAENG